MKNVKITIKTLSILLTFFLLFSTAWSQTFDKLSYQAIVRDSENIPLVNKNVGIRISILKDITNSTELYVETQTVLTNENGLISFEIGTGNSDNDFFNIDWKSGEIFIKTEIDPSGGNNYSIIATSQLNSVPYSFHSKTTDSIIGGINESDPIFLAWDKNYDELTNKPSLISDFVLDANNQNISNVASPINPSDAATKAYVDSLKDALHNLLLRIEALENNETQTCLQTVLSLTAFNNTRFTTVVRGKILHDGGNEIIERGVLYSRSANPTIEMNDGRVICDDLESETFGASIIDIAENTLYYFRTYAISALGESYGEVISVTTPYRYLSSPIEDIDGNEYQTIVVGDMMWMSENLKTTRYNDGTEIILMQDSIASTPNYCWYNNDYDNYGQVYGALYNWEAVNTGKLCPEGWHVPTENEWRAFLAFASGLEYFNSQNISGGVLKERGTEHWNSPNTGAIDTYGFSALPGGYRDAANIFKNIGETGYWWSATAYMGETAWIFEMNYDDEAVSLSGLSQDLNMSVRCVRSTVSSDR